MYPVEPFAAADLTEAPIQPKARKWCHLTLPLSCEAQDLKPEAPSAPDLSNQDATLKAFSWPFPLAFRLQPVMLCPCLSHEREAEEAQDVKIEKPKKPKKVLQPSTKPMPRSPGAAKEMVEEPELEVVEDAPLQKEQDMENEVAVDKEASDEQQEEWWWWQQQQSFAEAVAPVPESEDSSAPSESAGDDPKEEHLHTQEEAEEDNAESLENLDALEAQVNVFTERVQELERQLLDNDSDTEPETSDEAEARPAKVQKRVHGPELDDLIHKYGASYSLLLSNPSTPPRESETPAGSDLSAPRTPPLWDNPEAIAPLLASLLTGTSEPSTPAPSTPPAPGLLAEFGETPPWRQKAPSLARKLRIVFVLFQLVFLQIRKRKSKPHCCEYSCE